MRFRPVLALIAGYLAWIAAFWLPTMLLALVWPALRSKGIESQESGHFDREAADPPAYSSSSDWRSSP